MNEELKQKLTERFDVISAKAECDKDVRDALLKAYLAGGEYGYQYAVDKACEYFTHMKDCDFYEDKEAQKRTVDDFIDRFRKAMQ